MGEFLDRLSKAFFEYGWMVVVISAFVGAVIHSHFYDDAQHEFPEEVSELENVTGMSCEVTSVHEYGGDEPSAIDLECCSPGDTKVCEPYYHDIGTDRYEQRGY